MVKELTPEEIIRGRVRKGIKDIIREIFNTIEMAERNKKGKKPMPQFDNANWGAELTITGRIMSFLADEHLVIETSNGNKPLVDGIQVTITS